MKDMTQNKNQKRKESLEYKDFGLTDEDLDLLNLWSIKIFGLTDEDLDLLKQLHK